RNIGSIEGRQWNNSLALRYYDRSLKLYQEIGEKPGIAATLSDMCNTEGDEGKFAEALQYCQKSLQVNEEIDDRFQLAQTLVIMGFLLEQQGQHSGAIDDLRRALDTSESIGNKASQAQALYGLAEAYNSTGAFQQAIQNADLSASIAQQIESPDILANALTAAGKAYHGAGKPERAEEAFTRAIAAVEQLRSQAAGSEQQRQSFLVNRMSPYYWMANLLIDDGKPGQAFAFAERAKARTLLDVLESGKINIDRAMTTEENGTEQILKGRLSSLNSQIVKEKATANADRDRLTVLGSQLETARLEYEAFQTSLYAAHPELKVERARSQPITQKECGGLIPDTATVLLEFMVSDDKTHLFLLSKRYSSQRTPDLKAYAIDIHREDLTDLIDRFRGQLENRGLDYCQLATRLYDLLLRPSLPALRGRKTLVIVPDGPLWDLPFQALEARPNRYLIEDYAISLAPSLTALSAMSRPKPHNTSLSRGNTLLAMGNPSIGNEASSTIREVFMDADLAPLPEAERQVRAIAGLYGPEHSKVFVGAEATEDRARAEAPNYRILHFATHGIANNASPMYSQIILSQGKDSVNDGVLEAWEVMKLNLNADLVVLSACETARGRVNAGEGMIGLSWAFFVAGCRSTLVSQWKVAAASSTQLMVEFHKNLLAGRSKAESLRRAELKLLRSGTAPEPFDWAGFVVIGNGR
ncbi:MAG: CHAT domain-containing protein, partial [Blastocatellia bacterium]